jgi:hypothetical protein
MKSALENLKELREASKDYPSVLPLIGAVLELEEKVQKLDHSKQDKPSVEAQQIPAQELTRGNLQKKIFSLLTAAGDKEQEVALQIHRFLSSLE